MEPANPTTRDEILTALRSVETEVTSFFGGLTDQEFVTRVGEAWSPAEHLMHLNTSVSAVAQGLGIAKLALRFRFGRARTPSRPYAEMRRVYQERLAQGGRASGRFVPPSELPAPGTEGAWRQEILARWGRVNHRLRAALDRWSERDLDRLRMPHPLLGPLTTREMLFFTAYHNQHHIQAAKRRLPGLSDAPA